MITASALEAEKIEKRYWRYRARDITRDWRLYLMLVPLMFFLICWRYLPMSSMIVAFKEYQPALGAYKSPFVGIHWFVELMSGNYSVGFWRAFRNTFTLSFYGLCFGFPFPIILALLFSEIKSNTYRSIVQVFSYLPKFVSLVVITTLLSLLLKGKSQTTTSQAGPLTQLLTAWFGLKDPLNNAGCFRAIYVLSGIWESAGYSSIVYFAAIISISPTSYEAARIDGANKWQQVRHVTIPGMMGTLVIMLILDIGKLFSIGYEKVILLYNANTYATADIISTFVYRLGLGGSGSGTNLSAASGADFFNSIIAMLLVIGSNQISRRVSSTSLY